MIRLQSGTLKGQLLHVPSSARPTTSRMRQTLMNILAPWFHQARVLDLFSGSGAFGCEALSRGAAHCVFIDASQQAFDCIHRNTKKLGLSKKSTIIKSPVEKAKAKIKKKAPFDIVFADPPYADTHWHTLFFQFLPWQELLSQEGVVCLEVSTRLWENPLSLDWGIVQKRVYAESSFIFCTHQKKQENAV